jgi:outer membrane protein insertion porin family
MLVAVAVMSCKQAKYVPDGKYLLKKNEINFVTYEDGDTVVKGKHDLVYSGDMYELVRPAPNKKVKLFFYNRVDSAKYQDQLERKHSKVNEKNDERITKQNSINKERIDEARAKGDSTYHHKTIRLKPMKHGWRNWMVTKLGEPPVLLDTALVHKSTKQLDIFMSKRGFFDATVSDTVVFKEKKQKAIVEYTVIPGEPYYIDSISLDPAAGAEMANQYRKFLKAEKSVIAVGDLVDEDQLSAQREAFSKYCRDEAAYFEFNATYITFELDTNNRGHDVHVIMHVAPKEIEHPTIKDSIVYLPHRAHRVSSVTFFLINPDTSSFIHGFDAFKRRCDAYNLPYKTGPYYTLLDTLVNIDTISRAFNKTDSIVNKGVFIYNDVPFLDPDLIDKQNFLYIPHFAKEYYLERTYRTMLQLDVFSSITPKIFVDPANPFGTYVHVTYYLIPAKRQSFTIEPRLTNSNSVLGVMGSVSYTNKNMFRGAQKLKLSFSGGFESQPQIIDDDGEQKRVQKLNTFEWGPSVQLTFPRLVPIPKKWLALSSKRAYPSTTFDISVSFQKRPEFDRRLAAFSYDWSFKVGKTQEFKLKWINLNFVKLDKMPEFELYLDTINDPFLVNSYADHFSLFNQVDFHFNNQRGDNKGPNSVHDFKVSFIQSGAVLDATGWAHSIDTNGIKSLFGVPFTQFLRIDNQYVFNWRIDRRRKIAIRFLGGMGWAYGNSPSLPYEQSFYGGGSNDIRAFPARTMRPGEMQVDTLAPLTQIGDMRLELNLEYRFYITDILEGAFFVDMGNIWKVKNDPSTPLDDDGIFMFSTFWRQVAIGPGFGIRADFEFLIVRVDAAFPLHNPSLPAGERWWTTGKPLYTEYWDVNDNNQVDGAELDGYLQPHRLKVVFGIGYPF